MRPMSYDPINALVFEYKTRTFFSNFWMNFDENRKKYPKVKKTRKFSCFEELVLTQFTLFENQITWDLKLRHAASSSCNWILNLSIILQERIFLVKKTKMSYIEYKMYYIKDTGGGTICINETHLDDFLCYCWYLYVVILYVTYSMDARKRI